MEICVTGFNAAVDDRYDKPQVGKVSDILKARDNLAMTFSNIWNECELLFQQDTVVGEVILFDYMFMGNFLICLV